MSDRRFHNDIPIWIFSGWPCPDIGAAPQPRSWFDGKVSIYLLGFFLGLKTRDTEYCAVAVNLVWKQRNILKCIVTTKPLPPRGHQGDTLLHCGASTARLDVVDFCIKVWKWKENSQKIKVAVSDFWKANTIFQSILNTKVKVKERK